MNIPQSDRAPFRIVQREVGRGESTISAKKRLDRRQVPEGLRNFGSSAKDYVLDEGLETAVNCAITVGAPLLVTGKPGTGKSHLAHYLSEYFGIQLHVFHVKSTSTATDLKYHFDAVAYLRYAHDTKSAERTQREFLKAGPLWNAFRDRERSVLLIDEIDKAPRDFPNDLLNELDQHEFDHPFEPKVKISLKDPTRPPIVVVTSNAERRLPDAFLRRCVAFHIEHNFEKMAAIARRRRDALFGELPHDVLEEALRQFQRVQALGSLEREPSLAELLTWLAVLDAGQTTQAQLTAARLRDLPGIETLVKLQDDREKLP